MNMNDDLFPLFHAWKNWSFFASTILPQQPQHSIFPSKIHHTNCHVAVAESQKGGRYKIYSQNIFQFSCSYFLAILFWLSMKRKQKSWKWSNSRTFFSPAVFLQFNWDLKVFQARIWDLHLKTSQMFLFRHFGCQSQFFPLKDFDEHLKKCLLKDLTCSSQNFRLKDLSLISIFHT